MPALRECMDLVARISDTDADDLIKRVDDYIASGIAPEQAQRAATRDMLAELERDRGEILALAQAKVAPAQEPAAEPAAEPVLSQPEPAPEPQAGPRFYSALRRELAKAKTNAGGADYWRNLIKGAVNKGAVKADEVKWSGIDDWLGQQEGKVRRDAVLSWLDLNGVRVRETVLGEGTGAADARDEAEEWDRTVQEASARMAALDRQRADLTGKLTALELIPPESRDAVKEWGTPEFIRATLADIDRLHADAAEQFDIARDEARAAHERAAEIRRLGGDAKFRDWAPVPGGENYREVLLTLRGVPSATADWVTVLPDGGPFGVHDTEEEAKQVAARIGGTYEAGKSYTWNPHGFRGGHWDQDDVVAHVRVDDRVDAEGKKVLFVQEIQSDWAQQGRKVGWAGEKEAGDDGLPRAPFVQKTDAWVTLALKRIMSMAADGGYERVAFVKGEQANAKFGLEKHVRSLTYDPKREHLIAISPDFRKIIDQHVPAQKLPDYVGKEAADRLLSAPLQSVGPGKLAYDAHYLEGLDLKVGNEGMKKFYAEVVPAALKPLLKKYGGGQLTTVALPVDSTQGYAALKDMDLNADPATAWAVIDPDGETVRDGLSEAEAKARAAQLNRGKALQQPGFDVTPEMREKLQADDLPLFSQVEGPPGTPEFKAWFGDSKVVDSQGRPLVVYHGTTHVIDAFKPLRTNPESDFGRGIYMSNAREDADANYAGDGPDLTNRVERRAEQIASDNDWEYDDPRALAKARRELHGGAPNVIPLYVRMLNPLVLGGASPTYMGERAARKFASSVRRQVGGQGAGREIAMQLEDLADTAYDGAPADVLIKKAREAAAYVEDSRGRLVGPDVVRKAIQAAGYDGIVDHTVNKKWGSASGRNSPMSGVGPSTTHYIAFRPEQVKSVFNQRPTERPELSLSQVEGPPGTPEFQRWFGDSKVVDENGKPLVVYHGGAVDDNDEAYDRFHGVDWWARRDHPRWLTVLGDWFTASPRVANHFARGEAGTVYPVYLSIKRPKVFATYEAAEAAHDKSGLTVQQWRAELIKQGFDGIEIRHSDTDVDVVRRDFVPFHSNQVKSVFNQRPTERPELSLSQPGSMPDRRIRPELTAAGVTPEVAELFLAYKAADRAVGDDAYLAGRGTKAAKTRAFNKLMSALGGAEAGRGAFARLSMAFDMGGEAGLYEEPSLSQPGSMPSLAQPGQTWTGPGLSKLDTFIYNVQDKQIDLRRVTSAIREAGATLSDREDADLRETLFAGRVKARLDRFENDELLPLLEEMRMANVDLEDFGKFLHARHAAERNAEMKARNLGRPNNDALSGMSDADAAAILAAARPVMHVLAAKVDALIAGTRNLMEVSGIETADTVDALRNSYQHYVPLYREETDSDHSKHPVGSGFNVRGSVPKTAVGSTTPVVHRDILSHIISEREQVVVRAEKNLIGLAIYRMALSNPNPDFWATDTPPMVGYIDQRTQVFNPGKGKMVPNPNKGQVLFRPDPSFKSLPNVLTVRINGVERTVVFNKENERAVRMAASLKNLDVDKLGAGWNVAAKGTRWLAAVNTQYNPVFTIKNFVRDLGAGLTNLSTTPLAGMQAEVLAGIAPAMRAIYRSERGKAVADPTWAQLYEDFKRHGGKTGFREQYDNEAERTKALVKKAERLAGKAAPVAEVLELISDSNDAVENAIRVAAFKVALDKGMSKDKAAALAKNLTVNFNRRGAWGQRTNALYMFANAAVQGNARLLQTLRGPAGAKIIAGGLMLGVVQALALAAFMDDEEREAIPDWVKRTSIIIPLPGGSKGNYAAIPLPLGLHVIPNTGRELTELAQAILRGDKPDVPSRLTRVLGAVLDTLNPLGGTEDPLQMLAPTLVDPVVQLSVGKNGLGQPLYNARERDNEGTPGYLMGRDSTSPVYKGLAYVIHMAGNDLNPYQRNLDRSPALSPQPEALRLIPETIFGGVWRETEKLVDTLVGLTKEAPLDKGRVPLFSAFYGDAAVPLAQTSQFWQAISKADAAAQGARTAKKHDGEAVPTYWGELVNDAKGAKKRMLDLIAERRELLLEKEGPDRSVEIRRIEEEMGEEMRDFLATVRQTSRTWKAPKEDMAAAR